MKIVNEEQGIWEGLWTRKQGKDKLVIDCDNRQKIFYNHKRDAHQLK